MTNLRKRIGRRWSLALLLASVPLLLTCTPPSPRFAGLKFGPRNFELETRVQVIELKNGMTIALMPDARTNLVSVDVRYKVGAAEDPAGRAGMAHLVEHLSFELRPDAGAPSLEAELANAALVYNAYTNHDETHYWTIALAGQLDAVLALEARRMTPSCDQLDEAVFLRERDVVLEEEAERRAGTVSQDLAAAVWGDEHPYARPIGSREVATAERSEACEFLDDHYAPNRAILVVSGAFDPVVVGPAVAARFGSMTRRSRGTRTPIEPARLDGGRSKHEGTGKHTSVVVSFAAPAQAHPDDLVADLAARQLSLWLRYLAGEHEWTRGTAVWTSRDKRARVIHALVRSSDPTRVDDAAKLVYAAVTKLVAQHRIWGLEVDRSERRNEILERIDSFWYRGASIADRLHYASEPELFADELQAVDSYVASDIQSWARKNLVAERSHVLELSPGDREEPDLAPEPIADRGVVHDLAPDRVAVVESDAEKPFSLDLARGADPVEDLELANGLRVILAPIAGSLSVDARMIYPVGSGSRSRELARQAERAAYALDDDLSPDVVPYDAKRLDWVFGLGTALTVQVDPEWTTFGARGMALFADWHVWRLFWRLHAGIYHADRKPSADEQRSLDETMAEIRELIERHARHDRAVSDALFGPGHFWGDDLLATASATRAELVAFRKKYYRPRGATLIVSGGFERVAMRKEIEALFGVERDLGRESPPPPSTAVPPSAPAWIAVEDPEAVQVRVTVAVGALPDSGDRAVRGLLMQLLGDKLRTLRDGQGATYGVSIDYQKRAGMGALVIDTRLGPARAPKALTTVVEIVQLFRDHAADQRADFVRARKRLLGYTLADGAGPSDRARQLEALVISGLPLDATDRIAEEIASLTPADLVPVAVRDLAAATTVIVVSGPGDTAREVLEAAGVAPSDITTAP